MGDKPFDFDKIAAEARIESRRYWAPGSDAAKKHPQHPQDWWPLPDTELVEEDEPGVFLIFNHHAEHVRRVAAELLASAINPDLVDCLVHAFNAVHCRPPLAPAEVERLLRSAAIREIMGKKVA